MLDQLWEIVDSLNEEPKEWGEPFFGHNMYYEPKPLSTDNFNGFDGEGGERTICCVDGGNNKIYETPTDSVHLLRVYFNLFKGDKRVKNITPFSSYLISKYEGDDIVSELRPLNDSIPLDEKMFRLKRSEVEDGRPVNAGHTVRKYLEWKTIEYAAEEFLRDGDIVVKDGVLQTGVEEERQYADEAYGAVRENDVYLIGLAKTCSLRTDKGYSLMAAIQTLASDTEHESWYYHPVAENNNPDHAGEMAFVKYHPRSWYAFRTEFFKEQDIPVEEVLSELAYQAQDPIFLGYPYGLVDADKKARVTDEEIDFIKNIGGNKLGSVFRHKINSMNAHDRLSNI